MFSLYRAVNFWHGTEKPETDEEFFEAVQEAIDNGIAWSLEGSFGRWCMQIVEENTNKVKLPSDLKNAWFTSHLPDNCFYKVEANND